MIRKLVRIVQVDSVRPIPNADAIEAAQVGGWAMVIKKGEFVPGDLAVYFEIDCFLPAGNPAWQFLVDKTWCEFEGKTGHVLRTMTMRGQVSQGLLLKLDVLEGTGVNIAKLRIGDEVTEALGVVKYDPPIPENLIGKIRGYFPAGVHKTDQERIQNLAVELEEWRRAGPGLTWEVSEKFEGWSCTMAWLEQDLHVCSRYVDWLDVDDNTYWKAAHQNNVAAKMKARFGTRNIALQGELVGPGIEGNIYGLKDYQYYLYDVYDVDTEKYFTPDERQALAEELGIAHVPIIDPNFVIDETVTMDTLIAMADGESILKAGKRREGLVYKAREKAISFKSVSNAYLLKKKL